MTAPQEIRFCTTSDGVRIAFASVGDGPPLVCTTAWLTHLEHDLQSPFLGPWLRRLARHFRVVRYDGRGNGLSQRDIDGMSVDAWVRDLEAVADAARLERFPIYGLSQGAVVAVAYASRHPDRVERMLLHGGCARGLLRRDPPAKVVAAAQAQLDAAQAGWGVGSASFRRMFLSMLVRTASREQLEAFDAIQRLAISGPVVRMFLEAAFSFDVRDEARGVRCPTLVAHADEDPCFPFAEGALLASLIPGARLVTLASRNHLLVEGEPAGQQLLDELLRFMAPAAAAAAAAPLTPRQGEVLRHVARGLTDKQIARTLDLSPRTVEMHVARALDALGCHTRAEAVHLATQRGWLDKLR